ncbi:PDZ domain-containing protein [Niabella aquatica]
MKKIFLLITAALPGILFAQEKESGKNVERIIITKKGTDNDKMNIVVDGEHITVNGKPLKEDEKGNITVKRIKIKDLDNFSGIAGDDWSDGARSFRSFGNMNYIPLATNKAMLGVTTEKTGEGVTVRSVSEESAAEKAGIKEGDIITAIDGKEIASPDELSKALKDKSPGDKVEIGYIRAGKKTAVTATLTQWKAPQTMTFNATPNFELNEIFRNHLQNELGNDGNRKWNIQTYPNFSTAGGPRLGIKIQDVETGTGVKVIEVEKGSDADKAGLREGDIIKEANTVVLNSTDDLLVQKRKIRAGASMKLKVDRKGKSQNIDIVFSKKIKTADL